MDRYSALARVLKQRPELLFLTLFLFFSPLDAQVSDRIARISVGRYDYGKPLPIQIELSNTAGLDHIDLAYRQFGQQTFKHIEMPVIASVASASVPAHDLVPPFIEYYVTLYGGNETVLETYPLTNAELQPTKVELVEQPPAPNEIVILSPEPEERVRPDDVLISFSLTRFDSTADQPATKIYLDGNDISDQAVVSGDLFVISPSNHSGEVEPGSHIIRVEVYDLQGNSLASTQWNFSARGVGEQLSGIAEWRYRSQVQLETRNENIAGQATPYNRVTVSASGTNGDFRVHGKFYATNEEDARRQPQNRFFIGAESPWLKLGYGDSHPSMPDLIMNGKRVRGFAGALTLGAFSLDVVKGDIIRRIQPNVIKTFSIDSLTSEQQRDPGGFFREYDASTTPATWAKLQRGTFNRNLLLIRPAVGSSENRFGLSLLHSKDDIGSIQYGSKPQENTVAGTDLILSFDNRNIQFSGQAAFSFTNGDITSGTLTDADLDSIFSDTSYDANSRRDIERARDWFSRFITVNEHLKPLSLKNSATLAYEGALALNYFDNAFRFMFLRHGESFESFGQSYLRTDVVGFNLSDRYRASEQVILNAGFEQLKDNTAKTKATTTTFSTANAGVTFISKTEVPNVTVGYILASNRNPIHLDSAYAISDRTDRVLVQLGRQFQYHGQHNTTLGLSTSSRNDKTIRNLDTKNTLVTLGVTSTYTIPLQTSFSASASVSEFSTGASLQPPTLMKLTYTTLYANAQYRLAQERLRLTGTLSPTFGDIKRTLLDAGAQYFFRKDLSLQSQLSIYLNAGANSVNDVIWSMIFRLDI